MNREPLTLTLEPKSIAACSNLPAELKFLGNALQHQVDVFLKSRDHDIIIDLAPTGTGKTKAGLSVLLHQPNKTAIYIAPTNALVYQQKEAAEKFVRDAGLNHVVISASAKEVREWPNDRVGSRPGEKIYNLLRNPATIFPEIGANRPVLLVTNPDLFYYATFFAYNKLDQVNIASSFYNKFATIIFDEFHLYDAKQLVSLLFYLALSKVFGFFKQGRRIVLLTATPEPACEEAFKSLEAEGVKIARIDGETENTNLLPSQTSVQLELRPELERDQFLKEIVDEICQRFQNNSNHNGAVILDSKDYINRLADLLKARGYGQYFGRITGSTPAQERLWAAQQPIILATSTVDVGFNFERHPDPPRQNLDWLIFSTRDRASFWQRIGRVGRVLGKLETHIPSDAIAYLPDIAWEQGLTDLDLSGGREALKQKLSELPCLERPFLKAYWQSEAFLEIARPLLEMEEMLDNLSGSELILQLFETLKLTLGGKRTWQDYRYRMKVLRAAEKLSKTSLKSIKKEWKYIKGGQALIKRFLGAKYPERLQEIDAGIVTLEEWEEEFREYEDAAEELKTFAEELSISYTPIFQFRFSLFESLHIRDPYGLLLDQSEETDLDPIHLLRYYEFATQDEDIVVTSRAEIPYQISFRWRYSGSRQEFINTQINKLIVLKNCNIERKMGDAIAPTPLLNQLEKSLLPGVIICPISSAVAFYRLKKERIPSYPITVRCNDVEKEYAFLPGIAGILTVAMSGLKIRLLDEENFWIA